MLSYVYVCVSVRVYLFKALQSIPIIYIILYHGILYYSIVSVTSTGGTGMVSAYSLEKDEPIELFM